MKSIPFLLTLITLSTFPVHAATWASQNVSFSIDSNTRGSARVYYNCSVVRSETKLMIQKMGGTDAQVSCSGGLDGNFPQPAYVQATFNALTQGTPVWVKLQDNDNCHLANEIYKGIRDSFVINDENANDSCWRPGQGYLFEVSTLKE